MGRNLSSLVYQILHFTSCWVHNLLTGHGSATSFISQTIHQMQHDWDQAQAIIAPIGRSIGFTAAVEDPNNPTDLALESAAPIENVSGD